jgi:multimeric flavodoxin WrbA
MVKNQNENDLEEIINDNMNVFAINESPRKDGNTAMLLQSAARGAKSVGASTEIVHLYDLNFKGCIS